jgi:hypothetical protein
MPNTISGITNFGTPKQAGGVRCMAAGANFPGVLVLQSFLAGNPIEWYLWVSSTGALRIGAVYPTAPDTDGTVIGTQT